VFDDFGMGTEVDSNGQKRGFKVIDPDGEQPKTCYIESITKVKLSLSLIHSRILTHSHFHSHSYSYLSLSLFFIFPLLKDVNGIVTVVESQRHDLEDGNVVRITEVEGMTEVNGKEFKIQVKGLIICLVSSKQHIQKNRIKKEK
jgi:hypothetical protein